jgi:hypothetical protein
VIVRVGTFFQLTVGACFVLMLISCRAERDSVHLLAAFLPQ